MKSLKPLLLAALLFSLSIAFGQSAELPVVLKNGIASYERFGAKSALENWLKGSPLEKDALAVQKLTESLVHLESEYGKMIGWSFIRNVDLGSVQRVYITLNYEKGPAYAWFDCYQSSTISAFDFNTQASAILPPSILGGRPEGR
jgi:hypothetical protein